MKKRVLGKDLEVSAGAADIELTEQEVAAIDKKIIWSVEKAH